MTKPMSAAQYRANARAFKAKSPSQTVTLTSGSVFELRRPDVMGALITGRIPQSLLNQGLKAWQESGKVTPEDVAQHLESKDVIDGLIFMREIVAECCVHPRFVEIAIKDDEIGAADMLVEDFNEIFAWAMNYEGVEGIAALRSFRGRQARGTSGDLPDGAELQPTTIGTDAN